MENTEKMDKIDEKMCAPLKFHEGDKKVVESTMEYMFQYRKDIEFIDENEPELRVNMIKGKIDALHRFACSRRETRGYAEWSEHNRRMSALMQLMVLESNRMMQLEIDFR